METVRRNLAIAGAKGRLLCYPTHMLEPDVDQAVDSEDCVLAGVGCR